MKLSKMKKLLFLNRFSRYIVHKNFTRLATITRKKYKKLISTVVFRPDNFVFLFCIILSMIYTLVGSEL